MAKPRTILGPHDAKTMAPLLGERYGWGHSYNARDCTGFIMEILIRP